jgi:hypothetical protein
MTSHAPVSSDREVDGNRSASQFRNYKQAYNIIIIRVFIVPVILSMHMHE